MKHRAILLVTLLCTLPAMAEINLQAYYDAGSEWSDFSNRRSARFLTTMEMLQPDKWGETYWFVDFGFSVNRANNKNDDPRDCPIMAYTEIARRFNFWSGTPAKDLSLQFEYNGGLYISSADWMTLGQGINHAILLGFNYHLYTADKKNDFNLTLQSKFIIDQYNYYLRNEGDRIFYLQPGNRVPLQFTFTWDCRDFCTLPGLSFRGYTDIWGEKHLLYNYNTYKGTDPEQQSFVWIMEPQIWYAFGRWFDCPNLAIGMEMEFSYNHGAEGFTYIPRAGIRWVF